MATSRLVPRNPDIAIRWVVECLTLCAEPLYPGAPGATPWLLLRAKLQAELERQIDPRLL
jgi:hypothetical protein